MREMKHYKRRDFTVTCRLLRSISERLSTNCSFEAKAVRCFAKHSVCPANSEIAKAGLYLPILSCSFQTTFDFLHGSALATNHFSVLYPAAFPYNFPALTTRPGAGHLITQSRAQWEGSARARATLG